MKTQCLCSDPKCPVCFGKCQHKARTVVRRVDMEDRTGTPMCNECAEDAMESGLFTLEPWLAKYWK